MSGAETSSRFSYTSTPIKLKKMDRG